tara:strand:+ start:382 stop:1140 length:759 start_codon:yes stop_codon:yes gene_type:complete
MSNETQQEQSNEQTNQQPLTLYTDTLDSIPEPLHSFYEKQEDGYKLNVKNAVPSAKLDEFRTNNRKLNAELEEMRKQMSYVDMDEYNRLKDQYSKEKAKGSIPETDVEQTLAKRTSEMKAEYEKKLAELNDNYSQASQKLSTVLIDNQVQSSAAKHNVKQTAFEDVLLRAKNTFSLQDGVAVAKDSKGETIYNSEGEPLTIDQWINKLQKTAGHLFEESTGVGAKGQTRPVQQQTQMSSLDKIQAGLRAGNK